MPLSYTDIQSLINGRIIENTTQDITATYVNDLLHKMLFYSQDHDVVASRIPITIARVTDMNTSISNAVSTLDAKILGGVNGTGDTLKKLLDKIDGIINAGTPDPIPAGLICMWSGTTPPSGWALCDGSGTNNTPDLRGRFIVGQHPTSYPQAGNYSDKKNAGVTTSLTSPGTGGIPEHFLDVKNIPRHHHEVRNSGGNGADVSISMSASHSHSVPDGVIRKSEMFRAGMGMLKYVNDYVSSPKPTTDSKPHEHINSDFAGRVGDGRVASSGYSGLPSTPDSIDNRPPYYTLAYIMKM